jgi:hypothetical protein
LWITLAIAFPLAIIRPAYAYPRLLIEADLPAKMVVVNQDYAGEVRLRGLTLSPDSRHPGDNVIVTLYWQALKKPSRPYSIVLSLLGRSQQVIAHADTYPGRGTYPMDLWEEGQLVEDKYTLRLTPEAIVPSRVQVFIGLWLIETGEIIEPPPAILPTRLDFWLLPEVQESTTAKQSLVSFEEQVSLIRYSVKPSSVTRGEPINITLEWMAQNIMAEDFTVFTHLIDDQGRLIGQNDRQPANGDWPTSLWIPKMAWRDKYEITVSPQATANRAHIEIGLYRLSDGTRLATEAGGDSFRLSTPIEIQP